MLKNSYWANTGRFQAQYDELAKLIPPTGKCLFPRSKNKKLEKLRAACNAYYDIFNNGGMNRASEIRYHFNVSMTLFRVRNGRGWSMHWDRIAEFVDPVMDRIILEAAAEQGIEIPR